MKNYRFNAPAILNTVLPAVFGDNVPAPLTDKDQTSYYHDGEDILRRWRVTLCHWEDGEAVYVQAPAYKGDTYTNQLTAVWRDFDDCPCLSLFQGGEHWEKGIAYYDSTEDQARAMVDKIKEVYNKII